MLNQLESFLIDVDNAVDDGQLPAIDKKMMLIRIKQLIEE